MRTFFKKNRGSWIWLAGDLAALAFYFGLRGNRGLMNAFAANITTPLKRTLGRVSYLTSISLMEVIYVLAVVTAVGYAVWWIVSAVRCKGRRREKLGRGLLLAADAVLACWAVFCLLWGVNFWIDGFQDLSGIRARPVSPEELTRAAVHFVRELRDTADQVERDENGSFAAPREEILAAAPTVYDPLEAQFPFLAFDDPGVKAMAFSRLMSMMGYTGFYCSYTGESNVNVDSPACLLPATVAHELGHQRGFASEQECNFLAVLACGASDDVTYRYSGALDAFIYLGSAVWSLDPELYRALWSYLPETAQRDLMDNTAYWDQFRDKTVNKAADAVYDAMLKAYGEERGIQSYGTVVDLLAVYYGQA